MMEKNCDILVVGGGVSGMAAALVAARRGAKTLLVERCSQLGGMLYAGLNFPICGLFGSDGALLNGGLSRELFCGLGGEPKRVGRVWVWAVEPNRVVDWFSGQLTALGVEVLLATELGAVREEGQWCLSAQCGEMLFGLKALIDCSGRGAVLQASSVELLDGDPVLAGFLVTYSRLSGALGMLPVQVPFVLRKAVEAGELAPALRFSTFGSGVEPGVGYLKLSLAPDILDPCSQLEKVEVVLRREIGPFFSAVRGRCSPEVLPREGIRLRGDYLLTEQDVCNGARFDDAVVRGAWPVEHWDLERGPQWRYLADGSYYEIPARCLSNARLKNLYAAGRCISVDSGALASIRVMGTCLALGEAAAGLACEEVL
jgi:hypothetical protein